MDSIQNYKKKLALLDAMLSQMNSSHAKVRELRRSVYILKTLLKDEANIKSPYGPATAIVRFSIQ